jgi:hypothetical protein
MLYSCILLFGIFIAAIFLLQRLRHRTRKRSGKKRWGYYPSAATIGNALQTLQALTRPSVKHVIEQKLDDAAQDDESGGPDDPVAHLHHQARLIRRGNPPDRLTTKLRPHKKPPSR